MHFGGVSSDDTKVEQASASVPRRLGSLGPPRVSYVPRDPRKELRREPTGDFSRLGLNAWRRVKCELGSMILRPGSVLVFQAGYPERWNSGGEPMI